LDIRWPNGNTESVRGVKAGQIVTIKEGSGVVHAQPFAKASAST
jgi:hypothetical protein